MFSGLAYQAISDEIRASMPMPNFGSLMLPDSDPRVKDALHKLEEKAMTEVEVKGLVGAWPFLAAVPCQASGSKETNV